MSLTHHECLSAATNNESKNNVKHIHRKPVEKQFTFISSQEKHNFKLLSKRKKAIVKQRIKQDN